MSAQFVRSLFVLLGLAAAVGLVVAGLIAAGTSRRAKRYRPGRPFSFTPVWFLAAPHEQSRAGLVPDMVVGAHPAAGRSSGVIAGRELATRRGAPIPAGLKVTGGASEQW